MSGRGLGGHSDPRGLSFQALADTLLREGLLSLKTFGSNFSLVFYVRAGVALLARALSLLRTSPRRLLSWNSLLGERHLGFRVEAVRFGVFVGGFVAIYRVVRAILQLLLPQRWHAAALAGAVASSTLAVLPAESRRTFALYAFARALQCGWNLLADMQRLPASVPFGAVGERCHVPSASRLPPLTPQIAGLFALSSASVMYAYVMRPDTLPASYNKFIVRTGPIAAPVLEACRRQLRGEALTPALRAWLQQHAQQQHPHWLKTWYGVSPSHLASGSAASPARGFSAFMHSSLGAGAGGGATPANASYLMSKGKVAAASWLDWAEWWRGLLQAIGLSPTPPAAPFRPSAAPPKVQSPLLVPAHMSRIPASLMYPRQRISLLQVLQTALDAGKRVLPLYISLNLVPTLLFRWRSLIKSPTQVLVNAFMSALRSSTFIAGFVGSYMAVITTHRWLFRGDNKLVYWVAGLAAGGALVLERPSRHIDLMLYVLPRAADSLHTIMADRRWVGTVQHGEVLLFALAMGVLLGTFEREQQEEEEQETQKHHQHESDSSVPSEGGLRSTEAGKQQRMMAPFLRSLLRFLLGPTPALPGSQRQRSRVATLSVLGGTAGGSGTAEG